MWLTILLSLLLLLLLSLLTIFAIVVVDATWGCREEENSNGFWQLAAEVNIDCPFVKCGVLAARPKS